MFADADTTSLPLLSYNVTTAPLIAPDTAMLVEELLFASAILGATSVGDGVVVEVEVPVEVPVVLPVEVVVVVEPPAGLLVLLVSVHVCALPFQTAVIPNAFNNGVK